VERKRWEGHEIDGRFHLLQYVGGSAHSAVFLTEFGEGTPQKAAIKLAPADSDKAETWMLRRELAAGLSHPGLLPIFQFGTCRLDGAGLVYAVMEASDDDLSQVIPIRPLAPTEAREMLMKVVETLAYVHREGFVHGRLTPANIMAVGDRVKISSDGLLRIGESSDDLPAPHANDPPESRAHMTPAGDVWSLGMMLVEVLTQRPPAWDHAGRNDPAVPETLGAPFLDIARGCLRKDPRSRCSLAEIAHALQPAALPAPRTPSHVAQAVPIAKPAALAVKKKRKYLLPAMGAMLAGSIVTGAMLRHPRLESSPAGTESHSPVASEPSAAPKKPESVQAAPPTGETIPDDAGRTSAAATPGPAPAPVAPAADTGNFAGSRTARGVGDRFVPEVPPEILGTIRGSVTVRVRVTVDRSGAVVDAERDSPAGSRYFDRVAVEAARRWKFEPANEAARNGLESTRLVRFEFRRDGCTASSDEVTR
jgi:TonB family protein